MTASSAQPLPRLNRADVPTSSTTCCARPEPRIERRHATAIAFARALQDVQIELHVTPTRIDVLDSRASSRGDDDDGRTRIRPIR